LVDQLSPEKVDEYPCYDLDTRPRANSSPHGFTFSPNKAIVKRTDEMVIQEESFSQADETLCLINEKDNESSKSEPTFLEVPGKSVQLYGSKSPSISPTKMKSRIPQDFRSLKPKNLCDMNIEQDFGFPAQMIDFSLRVYDTSSNRPQEISGSINNGVCTITSPIENPVKCSFGLPDSEDKENQDNFFL